ncbi:MAG TPA: hypothetical protein PK929_14455 [Quisquiliibacterium sp.]|nr:hypothetical protein [Quisquiliibacterium sp.]
MIVLGTRAHGMARRRHLQLPDGFSYHKSEWLETDQNPELSPTAFLIEQPPGTVLAPHFHRQNQFQVMVAGGGTIGRHALGPVTVHYAGAYTGYGPLVAGPQGLSYFTIRAVHDAGAMMVSTDRARMIRGPKRHETTAPHVPLDDVALAALRTVECVDLIAPAADALAVTVTRIPPGAQVALPDPSGSLGQFHMVLAGRIVHDGRALGTWEMVYVSAGEAAPVLCADACGAEVLSLQVPQTAAEYRAAA